MRRTGIACPFVRIALCGCFIGGTISTAFAANESDPIENTARKPAVIVLVGPEAASPNLEALLVELLTRTGITPRFVRQETLLTQQVLNAARGDQSIWVFIHVRYGGTVDLYFRDTTGQRFLLREFTLNNGLDDVGCEGIGQIVESAVATLLSSEEGLSRDQAKVLIDGHSEAPARKPVTQRAVTTNPKTSEVFGWLAAKYDAAFLGSDIGLESGPGLELGVGGRSRWLWRARLSYERYFDDFVDAGPITANLMTQKMHASFDIGATLSHESWIVLGLGAGTDTTRISPRTSSAAGVALSQPRTDFAPYSIGEARYEFHGRGYALAFAAYAVVPLVDTHYDLTQSSGPERLAAPARIQPGASLILALSPILGGPAAHP